MQVNIFAMSTASPAPDPLRTAHCTCARLRKITRQVTLVYDQKLAAHGLTVTQFSLMSFLRAKPGASVGAVASRMIMDPTAVTRALRPLERAGLVAVQPDGKDRRSRCLHLTDKGLQVFAAARSAWQLAQDEVDRILAESGQSALNDSLDDLIRHFQSAHAAAKRT